MNLTMLLGLVAVSSFLITWGLVVSGLGSLDTPNRRSLHSRPVPRSGGLAVLAAIGIGVFIGPSSGDFLGLGWRIAGVALLVFVGFKDDLSGVSVLVRLAAQASAALCLIGAGLTVESLALPGFEIPLSPALGGGLALLFVIWMINLYNFMDGMDGFAAGMTVAGFATLSLLAAAAGMPGLMAFTAIVAAAAAGFLVWNFPPARIFLGDGGSTPLGYLAAAVMLWGQQDGAIPLWLSAIVFSPFIVDATFTLLRRMWWGEKVWQAHRTHLYQRLVIAGWGHRRTVLAEYALMAACSAVAILVAGRSLALEWAAAGGVAVFYALLIVWVLRYTAASHRRSGE